MKKNLFLIVVGFIILVNQIILSKSNVYGKIKYESGEELIFHDLSWVIGLFDDGVGTKGNRNREIKLEFENTRRFVPLNQLRRIRILEYKCEGGNLVNVKLLIEMKNGVNFNMRLARLSHLYYIGFLDKLTGEITQEEGIPFGYNGKLNIREIQFD